MSLTVLTLKTGLKWGSLLSIRDEVDGMEKYSLVLHFKVGKISNFSSSSSILSVDVLNVNVSVTVRLRYIVA